MPHQARLAGGAGQSTARAVERRARGPAACSAAESPACRALGSRAPCHTGATAPRGSRAHPLVADKQQVTGTGVELQAACVADACTRGRAAGMARSLPRGSGHCGGPASRLCCPKPRRLTASHTCGLDAAPRAIGGDAVHGAVGGVALLAGAHIEGRCHCIVEPAILGPDCQRPVAVGRLRRQRDRAVCDHAGAEQRGVAAGQRCGVGAGVASNAIHLLL